MNNSPLLQERTPSGVALSQKLDQVVELLTKMAEDRSSCKFPEVMTARDVQDFLQISNQTFYDLKNKGIIRTSEIGPKRYLKSEIYKTLIDHLI